MILICLILVAGIAIAWSVDANRLEEKAAHFESLYAHAENRLKEEQTKNERLQAEKTSPYKTLKVQTVEEKISSIGITVEVPYEYNVDEYLEATSSMIGKELWDIMRPRAIIAESPNYRERTTTIRFRWYVNEEGGRDSFL